MATKIKTVGSRAANSPHCFAAKCHLYVCDNKWITFEHKNSHSYKQNVYTFWLIESVNIYFESSLVIILLLSVKCKIPEKLLTDLPAVTAELFNFRREMNRFLNVIAIHVKIHWKEWSISRKLKKSKLWTKFARTHRTSEALNGAALDE